MATLKEIATSFQNVSGGQSQWTTQLRSPHQAGKVYSTGRYYSKQQHLFTVKFGVNGAQVNANLDQIASLTFVAKMVDRPKIDPKTEELHEYNKRRQVYTGLKYQPIRIQFYDDAHGRALAMWQDYSAYYFGDFDQNANKSYKTGALEIKSSEFDTDGTSFGLIPPLGGVADGSVGGQFYFHDLTICHYYDNLMDRYTLTNPRISLFEPDDLDYEKSGISMISMTIVYENLKYELQIDTSTEHDDDVFGSGKPFDGDVMEAIDNGPPREFIKVPSQQLTIDQMRAGNATKSISPLQFMLPGGRTKDDPSSFATSHPDVAARSAASNVASPEDYRYNGSPSTGSLGMFGDYQFGPTTDANLGQMAMNNFPLAASLNTGAWGNPLALDTVSMLGAMANPSRGGISGANFDVALARASQGSSGYGNTVGEVVTSMLASAAIGAQDATGPSGIVLAPEGYGVMNSRQTGTAQFGFNKNTGSDGSAWGYTGAAGYQGPYGYYNDGPYATDRPSGLVGRTGIEPEPITDNA